MYKHLYYILRNTYCKSVSIDEGVTETASGISSVLTTCLLKIQRFTVRFNATSQKSSIQKIKKIRRILD